MGMLGSLITLCPAFDARVEWKNIVMHAAARYARGNVAARDASILMPEEQEDERARARIIAVKWRARAASAAAKDIGKNKCFNPSLRAALFAPRSNPESAAWTLDCFGAKRRLAMTD
jgi:hypothetical protein